MIVPSTINFSDVPVAAVVTQNSATYFMKIDGTTWIDLSTAIVTTGILPGSQVYLLPAARLVLG